MAEAASNQSGPKETALPPEAAVIIIGGGIAGLATAWQLAALGVRDVVLLEGEGELATHASARNAGIFLPLEESLTAVWLANRSRDLLDAQIGTSWLSAIGVSLLSARADALEELQFTARRLGVYHERWTRGELTQRVPSVRDGVCTEALHLPLGGVIDVRLMLARMRKWAREGGVSIATSARVAAIDVEHNRVTGVLLADGRRLPSERVVLAAGAWAARLGQAAGSSLALTPLRRHLVQLVGDTLPSFGSPVTWRIDQPVYFRPQTTGLLASPCDETPSEPGLSETDPSIVTGLRAQLHQLAPTVAAQVAVQSSWTCLRTVARDRELAVGADGRVKGLYWCAGLGGRGMTCGSAAGELLARTMLGLAHPLAKSLTPERFL